MNQESKRALVCKATEIYQLADKKAKAVILDTLERETGYHRKHIVRLLLKIDSPREERDPKPKGRPSVYHTRGIEQCIRDLAQSRKPISGRKLAATITDLLPDYINRQPGAITEREAALLRRISHSSVERILRTKE